LRRAAPRALPSFPTRRSSDLATLAALLAALLLLGSASAVMVDEDGYLEEILLEDGVEIQFDDSQADASLQASLDKVNELQHILLDRKSTRLNSSHVSISYAVF